MYRRSEYTYADKQKILEYIIIHKSYQKLRGNSFWQEMESGTTLGRTWQSLKEHFRKKIIDIIHVFDIPQEEKLLIKSGWLSSQTKKKDSNRKISKRPRYHKIVINEFSDDDSNKIKRNKKDVYTINDDSDSSSYIEQKTNLNRRKVLKSKCKTDRCQRSPSEFNFFSDEDDIQMLSPKRKQIIEDDSREQESPDLLNYPNAHQKNSTQQRQKSQNVNKINNKSSTETTKQHITSVEETSCRNLSIVFNSIEPEIKLKNHSHASNTTDELSQSFGFTTENYNFSNIHSKEESKGKQNRTNITQHDSQYLESIPSQKGSDIRNLLTTIVDDPININHSVEFPSSIETFHTAMDFSQN